MIKKPLKYCLLFFFAVVMLNGEILHSNMYEMNDEFTLAEVVQLETCSSLSDFSGISINGESTNQSNQNFHFNNLARVINPGTTIDITQILFGDRIKLGLQI